MRTAGLGIVCVLREFLRACVGADTGAPETIRSRDLRRACRSWWGGGLALVLLGLTVYVPGQVALPPIDRDESRFAQASRQMHESGDYVVPRVQDTPRLNKPPLIYWAQNASIALFGDAPEQYRNGNIWVFRVPSALAMLAAVLLTWRLGLAMFDPRAAVLGGALLAVCPLVAWEAHQARADALLLATTTAAMLALYVIWRGGPEWGGRPARLLARLTYPTLFWLALAAGILTKGPITPLVAGLTVAALCLATHRTRWLLDLRPLLGLGILTAAVAPWVIAVGTRVGWSTYLDTIYQETVGRSTGSKEGHWGPPGYHLVLFVALFWPGSLLTGLAVARAFRRALNRAPGASPGVSSPPLPPGPDGAKGCSHGWNEPRSRLAEPVDTVPPSASRPEGAEDPLPKHPSLLRTPATPTPSTFLLCWLLPTWLLFELIATKLPHYTLPLYPAAALLSARAVLGVVSGGHVSPAVLTWGARIGFAVWFLVGAAVLFATTWLLQWDPEMAAARLPDPTAIELGTRIGLTAFTFGAAYLIITFLHRGRVANAQIVSVALTILFLVALLQVALPRWPVLSPKISAAIRVADPSGARPIGALEYHEDSLIFLTRGRAQRIDGLSGSAWVRDNPTGLLIAPVPIGKHPDAVPGRIATFRGFNYSNGDTEQLQLLDLTAPGAAPLPDP